MWYCKFRCNKRRGTHFVMFAEFIIEFTSDKYFPTLQVWRVWILHWQLFARHLNQQRIRMISCHQSWHVWTISNCQTTRLLMLCVPNLTLLLGRDSFHFTCHSIGCAIECMQFQLQPAEYSDAPLNVTLDNRHTSAFKRMIVAFDANKSVCLIYNYLWIAQGQHHTSVDAYTLQGMELDWT